MGDTLKKAILQTHLTEDCVDAQFCSDWLKDEIKLLFSQLRAVTEERDKLAEQLKVVVKEEWKAIHMWKPSLHWCRDWDFLLIDNGDPEFENCLCENMKKYKTKEKK